MTRKSNLFRKLPRLLVPLFECGTVYLCKSREEWIAAYEWLNVDDGDPDRFAGLAHTLNYEDKQTLYMIGVFDGNISTLVHEAAHVAFYICRDVGVTLDINDSNETYAYLIESIIRCFGKYVGDKED